MKPTICFYYKSLWHTLSRIYNAEAVKHDFTAAMGFVLLNIDSVHGTPATRIAPALGMEPKSLSRMLNTMEKKKLIVRKADEKDKRMVYIHLTEEGKRKKELSRKTVWQLNRVLREQIPAAQLDTFVQVSRQVNEVLKNQKIF